MKHHTPPFFAVEILKAGWIPHRWLFDDEVEAGLERGSFQGAPIYYLTRTKKLRFVPETAKITSDEKISVEIVEASVPIARASIPLRSLPHLSSPLFDKLEDFSPKVDFGASTNVDIFVNIQFGNEVLSQPVLPIELFMLNNDLLSPPEILYIGQSSSMLKRWRNHEQINRALGMLHDDEELRLYYLHFAFWAGFDSHGDARWKTLLDTSDKKGTAFRDRISVLEQALIHFYLPILNSRHVKGVVDTVAYRRIIEATGIRGVGLSLGMHGPAFQFWSPNQRLKSEVITLIDDHGVPTFHEGLIELETIFQ